jgi:septal ring factor EnvC (AmiA/AmiB activator)
LPCADLPGLDGRRGRLTPPLAGRLRIRSGFGNVVNPRYGTRTVHNGIVLTASEGEPIVAVADGRVVFADWYKGFGRCLVLDHGGGWLSVYAHARGFLVAVSDDVSAGQALAEVGDTGSLDGSQLYFQLTRDGQPLDPADWLSGMP